MKEETAAAAWGEHAACDMHGGGESLNTEGELRTLSSEHWALVTCLLSDSFILRCVLSLRTAKDTPRFEPEMIAMKVNMCLPATARFFLLRHGCALFFSWRVVCHKFDSQHVYDVSFFIFRISEFRGWSWMSRMLHFCHFFGPVGNVDDFRDFWMHIYISWVLFPVPKGQGFVCFVSIVCLIFLIFLFVELRNRANKSANCTVCTLPYSLINYHTGNTTRASMESDRHKMLEYKDMLDDRVEGRPQ